MKNVFLDVKFRALEWFVTDQTTVNRIRLTRLLTYNYIYPNQISLLIQKSIYLTLVNRTHRERILHADFERIATCSSDLSNAFGRKKKLTKNTINEHIHDHTVYIQFHSFSVHIFWTFLRVLTQHMVLGCVFGSIILQWNDFKTRKRKLWGMYQASDGHDH